MSSGGGGRRGRGTGGRSSQRSNSSRRGGTNPRGRPRTSRSNSAPLQESNDARGMRDEDVLIAFMPYLKGDHAEAARIHEDYQASNDQRAFLRAARDFLEHEKQTSALSAAPTTPIQQPPVERLPMPIQNSTDSSLTHLLGSDTIPTSMPFSPSTSASRPDPPGMRQQQSSGSPNRLKTVQQNRSSESVEMRSIQNRLDALLTDDPIVPLPGPGASIWGNTTASPITPPRTTNPSGSQEASPWNGSDSPTAGPPPGLILPPCSPHSATVTGNKAPVTPSLARDEAPAAAPSRPLPKREAPPPKRVWTHFEEQPGRISVNGYTGEDPSLVLAIGPREELTAHWSLPVDYLKEKAGPISRIEDVLEGLKVGLFRRGCTENGSQASIISKSVLGDDHRSYDFWKDPTGRSIVGKVPFFSPRTPGHVLFRLYWEKEPLYTLAMGPTLRVRVLESDFESSVRFILSNFKGRKSNPTSLSSLHSLAIVLETPLTRPNESAARATWGCIQEARKVIEACAQEYSKASSRLAQLEEAVEELKKQVEDEETKSQELSIGEESADLPEVSEAAGALREKTRSLLSGRASSERKWRDSQLAFASILKSVVTNRSMEILLRRELIAKMRIEFELWCPMEEQFALPTETAKIWYEPIKELPHAITADDFRRYAEARVKMQMRTTGFDLNVLTLEDVLFPRSRCGAPNQRSMDPGAVNVFNNMSAAMGMYYQNLHVNEGQVVRQRELIRERTERCVQECGAFPPGTRVAIFGSSANGFGSPQSDIDMCLQLPDGYKLDAEDKTGSGAMAKLAEYFSKSGMHHVDPARLTARIPIIKYECPNPLGTGNAGDDLIECDLSMHNPLAVLNTSLLRAYAEITPVTRVLSAIIKRWAKARDINNPARHTLSSYGYIIMLLHFLTYHKRKGNGLVTAIAPPEGDPNLRRQQGQQQQPPLLPNLQYIDPMWPNFPKGTPYRELPALPRQIMAHPLEEKKTVNAYFYKPRTPNDKAVLQTLFPGQDLSLAILLASFFRYYAYEFDYKRHVVSLHSTAVRGLVEREVKAELDGWKNYSAALTIEDPFELFYDVAHVLRGGYFHRIRREFAAAYSKIADAASGRPGSWTSDICSMTGEELIDLICEPVSTDQPEHV